MTNFADKTGAYIAENHKVFNPDIFMQLYSQVKTLLNGKNLDDAVQLTVTAYHKSWHLPPRFIAITCQNGYSDSTDNGNIYDV